jgi:carboxymethylenebutenolidase
MPVAARFARSLLVLFVASMALTLAGSGQDAPATRPAAGGSMVTLKGASGSFAGYLAKPGGSGPHPGVIVVQEWWGLNDQIKGVADRIAAQGYVALAPDLYHGKITTDPEKAHEILRGLDWKQAVSDLGTGMDYLKSLPDVGSRKIGSVGFCMGGGLSLQLALNRSDFSAAVMFYGTPETDPAILKGIACPVLGLFGEEDQGIPREKVETMAKALNEIGKGAEVHTYKKAGHAFFNETRPSYVPEAAEDAWDRTVKFFRANLKE